MHCDLGPSWSVLKNYALDVPSMMAGALSYIKSTGRRQYLPQFARTSSRAYPSLCRLLSRCHLPAVYQPSSREWIPSALVSSPSSIPMPRAQRKPCLKYQWRRKRMAARVPTTASFHELGGASTHSIQWAHSTSKLRAPSHPCIVCRLLPSEVFLLHAHSHSSVFRQYHCTHSIIHTHHTIVGGCKKGHFQINLSFFFLSF